MVFNSFTFLIFFAIVLLIHYSPLGWTQKKVNLLVASYLFYAAWNPPFVLLLVLSTVVDWHVAKTLHAAEDGKRRRLLLGLSLFLNLGLLAIFKYSNFLLSTMSSIVAVANIDFQPLELDIILPVGISFYTFQTLSYTIDIYRRRSKPWTSFLDYAMYVTFFPQLVAGPIVRATDFLPQCNSVRRATASQFGWGLSLLVLGLFQKIVIADGLMAPAVETVYDKMGDISIAAAWCGTLAFACQIFCDFAGYSTCAIGVALCLGFRLPINFRFPYAAIGFSDFWSRWHISLSTWLRDYLYIPLGGNRCGVSRTLVNLMTTMLLGGLWHGASWTFVVWGGLHGLFLIVERVAKQLVGQYKFWQSPVVRFLLSLLTFALVCVTWVFFRAADFPTAFKMVQSMFGGTTGGGSLDKFTMALIVAVVGAVLAIHWLMRSRSLEAVAARCPWWLRGMALGLMLFAISTMPGEDRAFIYFRF